MLKHLTLSALCLMAASVVASAQVALIKQAKDAYNKKTPYAEVIQIITPAFTNPETAQNAEAFYTAGEIAFKEFDHLQSMAMTMPGKYTLADSVQMGRLLLDAYNFYMQALPLDSLPNEKGKIKPKFSGKIYNDLTNHSADYRMGGIFLYNGKDYAGAYDAWVDYANIQDMPEVKKKLKGLASMNPGILPSDEEVSEILYNAGLAAWNLEEFQKAYDAFMMAKARGYNKKHIYDYGMAVAQQAGNEDAVFALAQEAQPLYGSEDPTYVRLILNHYIQNKESDKAYAIIEEALVAEPENSQYYVFRGILNEQKGDMTAAKEDYMKGVEVNPRNAQALYYVGHVLFNEAADLSDKAPANPRESQEYFNSTVRPVLLEAVKYLENSVDEEPADTRRDALRTLENAYYSLMDEQNLEYTRKRIEDL